MQTCCACWTIRRLVFSIDAHGRSGICGWAAKWFPDFPRGAFPRNVLQPKLDVLPEAQRELWPALIDIPDSYVLYGGTTLALRLRHGLTSRATRGRPRAWQ